MIMLVWSREIPIESSNLEGSIFEKENYLNI